jgi:hypothetical protein
MAKGRLSPVLADWCPPYSGYHLFYSSRRQSSAAFALVAEALRDGRRETEHRDESPGAMPLRSPSPMRSRRVPSTSAMSRLPNPDRLGGSG